MTSSSSSFVHGDLLVMGSLPPFFLTNESELFAAEAAANAAKTSEVGSLIGISASTTLPLSAPGSTPASLPLASVGALRDADSMSSQFDRLRLLSVYRASWGRPTFRSRRKGSPGVGSRLVPATAQYEGAGRSDQASGTVNSTVRLSVSKDFFLDF